MGETRVLDASAIVAVLRAEAEGVSVREFLDAASRGECHAVMTTVNWGEALYVAARKLEAKRLSGVVVVFDSLPVGLVDVDRGLAMRAARLRHEHGLAYADAHAAALALLLGVPLMAKDSDFDALEPEGLTLCRLG